MAAMAALVAGAVAFAAVSQLGYAGGQRSSPARPGSTQTIFKHLFVDRQLFANASAGLELRRHRPHRAVQANGGRVLWPQDPAATGGFQGFGAYSGLMLAGDGTYRQPDGTIRMYYGCQAATAAGASAAGMCLA